MDQLLNSLDKYINEGLKKSLKYTEEYKYPKYIPDKDMILFKKKLTGPSGLKKILVSNPQVVQDLKLSMKKFISKYINNIKGINLYFNADGDFGFILLYNNEKIYFDILDTNTNANIASHLKNVDDTKSYCESSKDMTEVCQTDEFWRLLIKKVYNFPYKNEYNYEKLYNQYLLYKSFEINETLYPMVDNAKYFDQLDEMFRFLFHEDLIKEEDYNMFIVAIIQIGDIKLINKLFSVIKEYPFDETIKDEFFNNNIKFISNLLSLNLTDVYDGDLNEKNLLTKDYILDMIVDIVDGNENMSYEMWKLLDDNISDPELKYKLNTNTLLVSIYNKNTRLTKAILRTNNYDKDDVKEWYFDQYGSEVSYDEFISSIVDYNLSH
jgi:hypothetical protein